MLETKHKLSMILIVLLLLLPVIPAGGARLKDIVSIKGVRSNQLIGYGLVIGLAKTGDGNSSKITRTTLANMLENMGVTVDSKSMRTGNTAAVMVTTELPPFSRQGNRLDVLVSSVGDAKSLQGGTLLLTPLRGADGKVYSVAQGAVSIGGFSEESAGTQVKKNHPTVGNIPDGAIVEREVPFDFNTMPSLELSLGIEDFSTAARIAFAINQTFGNDTAKAVDPRTINVAVPEAYRSNLVSLMAQIENLEVEPDNSAIVVVNERTGTIVMGQNVRISKVAVSQGNLNIQIRSGVAVSQPGPFSMGQTVVAPQSDISVIESDSGVSVIEQGASIADVVRALNAIGVSPRDLVSILQSIKAAGALQARLVIQ